MQSKSMDGRRSEAVESSSECACFFRQDEFLVVRTYVNGVL